MHRAQVDAGGRLVESRRRRQVGQLVSSQAAVPPLIVKSVPVEFVMLSWNVTPQPGIIGPWFLWRLLIDERFQGRGFGREALRLVVELIRAEGATALLTSYQPGDGEPWPFYEKFGFVPTGEIDGTEVVLRLDLVRDAASVAG